MIYLSAIVISLAIGFLILEPILKNTPDQRALDPVPQNSGQHMRQAEILNDLELDYATGKVDDKDYQKTKKRLTQEIY